MPSVDVKAVIRETKKAKTREDLFRLADSIPSELVASLIAPLAGAAFGFLQHGKRRRFVRCAFLLWVLGGQVLFDLDFDFDGASQLNLDC